MSAASVVPWRLHPRVRDALTRRMFDELGGTQATTTVAAVLLAVVVWDDVPRVLAVGWLIALVAVQMFAMFEGRGYHRGRHTPRRDLRWLYIATGTQLLLAAAWGLAGPLFSAYISDIQLTLLVALIIAVMAANLGALSNHLLVYALSASLMVVPVVVVLAVRAEGLEIQLAIAVVALVSWVVYLRASLGTYQDRATTVDSLVHAEQMAEELEHERGERYRAVTTLLRATQFDDMTGLPSARQFREQLESIRDRLARDKKLLICFFDLAGFTAINETYGRVAGDTVLRRFADRLSETLRGRGPVCRVHGDTFAAAWVMEAASREQLDRLMEMLGRPVIWQDRMVDLAPRAGVAVYPDHGDDPDELLGRAEAACRALKQIPGSSDWQLFDPKSGAVQDASASGRGVAAAMERGEFRLVYQPQLDLSDGSVIGAEALLRWRRPDGTEVPPSTFLPMAERAGVMDRLGRWSLETACRQAAIWARDYGEGFHVAVNLAMQQLADPDVVDFVRSVLQETGLTPAQLHLEVTEPTLMAEPVAVAQLLQQFRQLGVRVALDDFGTGQASLSNLIHLDIDLIKLDGTITRGISGNIRRGRVVQALAGLARTLQLGVIAEGVEERSDWEVLGRVGVRYAQGYLFSVPVDAEGFPDLLERTLLPVSSGRRHPPQRPMEMNPGADED